MKQLKTILLAVGMLLVCATIFSCQNKQSVTNKGLHGVYVTDFSRAQSIIEENDEVDELTSNLLSMALSSIKLIFEFKENDIMVMDLECENVFLSGMISAATGSAFPVIAEYKMKNDSVLTVRLLEGTSDEYKPMAIVRKLGDYEYLRLKIIDDESLGIDDAVFTLQRVNEM